MLYKNQQESTDSYLTSFKYIHQIFNPNLSKEKYQVNRWGFSYTGLETVQRLGCEELLADTRWCSTKILPSIALVASILEDANLSANTHFTLWAVVKLESAALYTFLQTKITPVTASNLHNTSMKYTFSWQL